MPEQHECEPLCETITSFIEYAEEHGRLTLVIPVPLLKAILPILDEYETLKAELKESMDALAQWMEVHDARIDELEAENESLNKRYYGLLFSVETVHPGETRHETALRYIQEAEQDSDNAADAYSNDSTLPDTTHQRRTDSRTQREAHEVREA